jgi:hypothetical protein
VSIRLAVSKKKSSSEEHQRSPKLTIQEVDAICADIIVALLEQVSDLNDVSASEEEEDVCSICLDAIVLASAVSSNDDVNNLPDIKTLTDIKNLLCGDNPTIFSTQSHHTKNAYQTLTACSSTSASHQDTYSISVTLNPKPLIRTRISWHMLANGGGSRASSRASSDVP